MGGVQQVGDAVMEIDAVGTPCPRCSARSRTRRRGWPTFKQRGKSHLLKTLLNLNERIRNQRAAGEARLAVGAVTETALADGDDFDVGVFADLREVKRGQSALGEQLDLVSLQRLLYDLEDAMNLLHAQYGQ